MSLTYPTSWRRYITNPVTGNVYKDHEGNYLYMIYGMNNAKDYIKYVNTLALDNPNISIQDEDTTKYLISALKNLNLYDSVELLWTPQAGILQRVDGLLKYLSTGYDMTPDSLGDYGDNDLTQSTESQQPRLVGGIAPGSKPAAANLNGEGRYFTHPEISFGAGDEWSVTTRFSPDGKINSYIWRHSSVTSLLNTNPVSLRDKFYFFKSSVFGLIIGDSSPYYGKNVTVTITYNNGTLNGYVNGALTASDTQSGSYEFDRLFRDYAGTASAHLIQSQALTPTQVSDLHTTLRAIYPEIESVQIGTQTWATRNFEAVATPLGNVIANVTEAANVEKINEDFELGRTNWNGVAAFIAEDGVIKAINVPSGSTFYTKTNVVTSGKYYKATFDIFNYTSGNISLRYGTGAGYVPLGSIENKTYTIFFKAEHTGYFGFYSHNITNLHLDNVILEEVGWSGLGDLYTGLIAQGYTEYDALKETAAWCYYNNDPDNGAIYGKLYNWYAAKLLDLDMQTAGFGWRVPTSAQFTTLANYLGGASVAGGKMKMTGVDYWDSPNTGATNESGFTALPSGYRSTIGSFLTLKTRTAIWGVESANNKAPIIFLTKDQSAVATSPDNAKLQGFSLRLIKNS